MMMDTLDDSPAERGAQPDAGADGLELVELELALSHQDFAQLGFEGTVRRALKTIGGDYLFAMRMDGMNGCDWAAAVALNNGGDQPCFALVIQPVATGALRVERAETSDNPLARIVAAYHGLAGRLAPET